jgi:hypothetical protein
MNERRFESRFLCADLVQLDWVVGEDEFQTAEAVLEDICETGACVQIDQNIPLGTGVTISKGNQHFSGFVSYCVYRDYGYFVGVELSETSRWSSELFRPDHLTNPADPGHDVP